MQAKKRRAPRGAPSTLRCRARGALCLGAAPHRHYFLAAAAGDEPLEVRVPALERRAPLLEARRLLDVDGRDAPDRVVEAAIDDVRRDLERLDHARRERSPQIV